jgi:hypothetical protein
VEEDIEMVTVSEFEDLNDETRQVVVGAYKLAEKIRDLITEEAKAGRASHEEAWNAVLNILGWLTMSFGDPRREAAQAAEMLVHGVDANLTAQSKTKN